MLIANESRSVAIVDTLKVPIKSSRGTSPEDAAATCESNVRTRRDGDAYER